MFCLLLLLTLTRMAHGLLGFDCGGRHLNITTISLLDPGECDLHQETPNSTDVYIQLLQLSDYSHTEVIQCKVEISRTIYHCGMHSHISVVHNGRADYLEEVGYTRCLRMFQDGTLSLGTAEYLRGIRPNSTTTRSITLAGTIGADGACKGVQFSDPYGTWIDVVVQATARITIKSSFIPVHLNSGKVHLKSGTICTLSDTFCIDSEDGYSYWKAMPTSSCKFHQYDVLYEGKASKLQDDSRESSSPVVYSLTKQDITFALTKVGEQPLCGYTLLRTEHPKLFILETKREDTFASKGDISVDNLDIFTYVNSKFVYVEKHIRNQMTSLYFNVIRQRCELEKEVLTNTLSFATLLPDEFAFRLMKGPGYMAVTSGEAVHVVKCIPIEVTVRRTKECYLELPVVATNTSMFLTPKSHILTKYGTQRECSSDLPNLYRIEDTWIQLVPEPQVRQVTPQRLQPMAALTWNYLTPAPLAVSGIYTEQDIKKLRDHIMFPAEKPALINNIARGIVGHAIQDGAVPLQNFLDEDALNKIAESAAARIWSGFITFGSATAGVLGVFLIIRLTKLIIDTLIHGYALHTAYGCSLHLLGAIWGSITHLLLHLAHGPRINAVNGQEGGAPTAPPVPSSPPALVPDLDEDPPTTYYKMESNIRNPFYQMEPPMQRTEPSEQNHGDDVIYAVPHRRTPPARATDNAPDIHDDFPMRPPTSGRQRRNGIIVVPASRTSIDMRPTNSTIYTDLRERLNEIEQIP